MRAHEVTFLDLVQGEKQFQVPLYQRTYSWTAPQLGQLWRDVLEQSEAMAAGSAHGGHFMGSVVIAPSPTLQAGGVQRWLVVDGQQRLTTFMLGVDPPSTSAWRRMCPLPLIRLGKLEPASGAPSCPGAPAIRPLTLTRRCGSLIAGAHQ
jgi:hypothetical protein